MSPSAENIRDIPWVEKYRPRSLREVASQSLTIQSLQEFVNKRALPHLIFTGPAGTGKTSTAISLINDLVGSKNLTQDVLLERNASDESRMQDLPSIKNFVFHTGIAENTTFKFVVLDEADNLSNEVQSAFRRIIETAPPNVKFIFMCNYVENIIDPLISRCAIFRFYPLPRPEFEKQILHIAKNEEVPINKGILDAIYYISQGDMRLAINLFQMTVALLEDEAGRIQKSNIDPDIIYEISGFLPSKRITTLFSHIEAYNFGKAQQTIDEQRGLSSRALIRQLMDKIIATKYPFPLRDKILEALSEYDYRLTLEADPTIQINGMLAHLILLLQEGS